MKKYSWISYCSLLLSIVPIPFLFALMYALIRIHPDLGFSLVWFFIILSLLLGIIGAFKKTEKKLLVSLAILISIGSGLFFAFVLMMSQMGNPPTG